MTNAPGTHIGMIASEHTTSATPTASGPSQYWHDGGFTEPGGLAFVPHTYSFGDSSPSFFPNVDSMVEGSRLQGSSSATVPRTEHHQRGRTAAEFDYGAALRDVMLRREEEEKSQLGRDSELHRQAPSAIPFPSLDADGYYRDVDHREKERQRVRSMGASSQRGTRKESGRRDSARREGLRATKDTESLDQMKNSALGLYRAIRYKLQVGLSREDVDDEEDPKWLSQLLAQMKDAADSSEAKSTRGGGRAKKAAA
ncbi:hypothetical protein BDZ89DRAFT_1160604 [Hymenopellis radicata]|nr:hypothetical protein BDZ89DRAFT_1160604 [Hymenopellis radicata]